MAIRIKPELRSLVLFALHDLLRDSPFSRLDLVTCRNLLIYLNREAQARALEIFHFALQAEGILFLGSSESVEDANALFMAVDKRRRIYARVAAARSGMSLFPGSSNLSRLHRDSPAEVANPGLPADAKPRQTPQSLAAIPRSPGEATPWSQVHFELLEQLAPPSVLINQNHEILHLSEHAGHFLQVSGGEPTNNLLRLVHPMLRIELRAALYRAAQSESPAQTAGIPVETAGVVREVSLRVVPMHTSADVMLVVFHEGQPLSSESSSSAVLIDEAEPAIRQLERELERSKVHLRDTIEQAEASEEELKASNEELQAMNEELRSTTEELETGREELQSINEELRTVNQELKSKVDELGHSNSDLANLMAATQIATVFLDRDLSIQRYTPPAVALFNLIPTDIGRPLSDLTPRLNYPSLAADAEDVLASLRTIEVEVSHQDGCFYIARMLPYRTTDDRIAGVVLTFVDITRRREAEAELRASEERFRAVADLVPDLLFSTDPAGQVTWCNQRWVTYTGQSARQAAGAGWLKTVDPADKERAFKDFEAALQLGASFHSEHRLVGADQKSRWFLVRAEPLRDLDGHITQWFGSKTDIEDFKWSASALAASEERLRLIIENAREFAIFSMDREMRVTTWNTGAERLLGYSEKEILGELADVIFTAEDQAAGKPEEEARGAIATGRAADERWHQRKDGTRFWGSGAMMRMNDAAGNPIGLVKILHDQTEARETRESLERSHEDLSRALREAESAHAEVEAANKAKDHFMAVLSHELRTPLTPVLMAVHVLKKNAELPPSVSDALTMIERNIKVEAHFIDDLLDITRITRGKLEIVREPMDLHQAVRHAVEITQADTEAKNQHIRLELNATLYRINADETRLQQLFWNILKNASKFTPEGGSITITSQDGAGVIVVAITDSGIGFEAAIATRIFDAFEQADLDVARQFGGLGLGLAIAKATADAHAGSLRAESPGKNRGATFTLELPISPV